LVEDLAHLTACRGDQGGAHALRAVTGQGAAHADRLIVRMGLHRQQRQSIPPALGEGRRGGTHLPLRARTSWISCGTTLWTSPTTPRSAILKMGASGSLLMAMMVLAP